MLKFVTIGLFIVLSASTFAQNDSITYKKRVLESAEVDILSSYYNQDGNNAAVTGGIGTEKLNDATSSIVVSVPLNDDDVLTIDAGFSSYSSASSSNLNPFDGSGTSSGASSKSVGKITGSPWVASSGASQSDTWTHFSANYSHSSDDRNKIWSSNISFSNEFDYTSLGIGGAHSWLFNEKNTEIGIKGNVYADFWRPVYPTELDSYVEANGNLNSGFFNSIDIIDYNGNTTIKNSDNSWHPTDFNIIKDKGRNTYSLSLSFSQILSKKAQFSLIFDIIKQNGQLANSMQRVYFADKPNYFIGEASSITNYSSDKNRDVFMLADNNEQLPTSRLKLPLGFRFNYYINEFLSLRTYYRYYWDDWGITSNTANIEIPIKINNHFTLYPSYRYYDQTEADYFAPFDTHLSTSVFYTSDYDLSPYNAEQFGFGISYNDIFTSFKINMLGLKSIDLKYNYYKRNIGYHASYIGLGFKFVMQ